MRWLWVVWLASGCNAVFGIDRTDLRADAGRPKGPGCSSNFPTSPIPVAQFSQGVYDPQLGPDLLEIYFLHANPTQIYRAVRGSTTEQFGPEALAPFSNVGQNESPTMSGDGLRLLFMSDRSGSRELYEITRPSLDAPFGSPMPLTGFGSARAVDLSFDGYTVYFTQRDTTGTVNNIMTASRPTFEDPFEPATLVASSASFGSVSPDGLELFANPGDGSSPLEQHVRASTDVAFGDVVRRVLDKGDDPDVAPDPRVLVTSVGNQLTVLERECP